MEDAPMAAGARCPECGAPWPEGRTCRDDFHQMLAWEYEDSRLGAVHHLMVLCYHLQHPSLYSPEGLRDGQQLLVQFVDQGVSPAEIRRRNRHRVDSGNRTWKITARPGAQGAYTHAVAWPMTAAQVVAAGPGQYCANVRAWAEATLAQLKASGNLNPP
jgi:uncharacterized protein DUF5946